MDSINTYIDHTILKPFATSEDVKRICAEALEYKFASVCINPCYVPLAKELLAGSSTHVCTVIGFPLGQNTTAIKVAEAEDALLNGCEEFDMVINVGALKEGKNDYVQSEIAAVRKACEGHILKVIIETGLLTDEEKVTATKLACAASADFVKTCTGFSGGAATVEDIRLMKANVTDGVRVKASGGIKTPETAKALVEAGAERLGTSSGVLLVKG